MIISHGKANRGKNRVERRFRIANLILFVLVSLVMALLMAVVVQSIAKEISRDYARLYSTKLVGILNTHLNREIGIVSKAVKSRDLLEWFADEGDPEKKQAAYDEIAEVINVLYSGNVYFGVEGSRNEYSIEKGHEFEDFAPYDVLDSGCDKDAWYFECAVFPGDYVLNVDIDKLKQRKLVWLNHKVEENGEFLGVFGSGLLFDQVIQSLFAEYDNSRVRSFVIDEQGMVQMDSHSVDSAEMLIYEETRYIGEYMSDAAFQAAVGRHLGGIDEYFEMREPDVIELSVGSYRYGAIAPIEATNWAVVTLYDPGYLFRPERLIPLVITMLVIFVIYAVALGYLGNRMVFFPLRQLFQSVEEQRAGPERRLYGAAREDEFGALARTIQTMEQKLTIYTTDLEREVEVRSEQVKEAYERMARREAHLSQVFDSIRVGIASFNMEGCLIQYNKFFLDLFGVADKRELSDALNRDDRAFLGESSPDIGAVALLSSIFAEARTGKHTMQELELRNLGGRTFWADLQVELISMPEQPEGSIFEMYINNIQDKKEVEFSLLRQVNTDMLTGAYSRTYLESLLPVMAQAVDPDSGNLTFILMDIDHFKHINDTYGHDVGDIVLQSVCKMVMDKIRKSDIFARWGGEEFVILIQDDTLEGAAILAEKLRSAIENTAFPPVKRLTASFGIARWKRGEHYDSLFKRVDQALLQAKETGRNRVVLAAEDD